MAGLVLMAASAWALAQPQPVAQGAAGAVRPDAGDRRLALEQQRLAIEQWHRGAAASCEARFAVNACLAEADQARRQALAPLRQESLALDDAERQSRAMARAHQAAQRQQQVVQRQTLAAGPGASARPAPVAAPASTAALADQAPVAPEPVAITAPRGGPTAEATVQALQRAAAAEKRRNEAAADRARIAAKQAERARSAASSPGLPVPQQAFKP